MKTKECPNPENNPKCRGVCYNHRNMCKNCSNYGTRAYWKGKRRSTETKEKISRTLTGRTRSDEAKKKTSMTLKAKVLGENNPMFGKKHSAETRKKMRLAAIKRIADAAGQAHPNYNPEACKIIDVYGKRHGFNFQHAENGGEICVDGYFPDGIDIKQKTIIEVDENHHFDKNNNLRLPDIERQQYLEQLGYKIIRVKYEGSSYV